MAADKPTILFVEDDENDVLLVQRAFEKSGVDCHIAWLQSSRKAIDYLSGRGAYSDRARYPFPRLLLLDLKLIGSSGFEVMEWLKDKPERSALPVVIFSSSWVESDRDRARELGVDDYVIKPNGFVELLQVTERLHQRWLAGR